MLVGTLLQCGVSVTASNLTGSWLLLRCSLVCKCSSNGSDPTAPSRYATRSAPWRLSPAFIYCLVGGCSSGGVTSHLRHGCNYSSRQKIRQTFRNLDLIFLFCFTESAVCFMFALYRYCSVYMTQMWRAKVNLFALGKSIKSSSEVYSHTFPNPWTECLLQFLTLIESVLTLLFPNNMRKHKRFSLFLGLFW